MQRKLRGQVDGARESGPVTVDGRHQLAVAPLVSQGPAGARPQQAASDAPGPAMSGRCRVTELEERQRAEADPPGLPAYEAKRQSADCREEGIAQALGIGL